MTVRLRGRDAGIIFNVQNVVKVNCRHRILMKKLGIHMKKDELGSRMKNNYEDRTRFFIPRRTYTIIRLDGKSFHTYTKSFSRPYDLNLMRIMDKTAIALCEDVQGVKLAYVQSDEISLILTDFETIHTDAWFDGNIQKITSISASMATVAFNNGMYLDKEILASMDKVAYFDSRVFSIPDREEVINMLIWRQQDATRNSIHMGAQSLYSHKELHGKNTSQLQELMFQKGVNWDKYPVGFKRGRIILKEKIEKVDVKRPDGEVQAQVERFKWASFEPPIFTQDKEYLRSRIPLIGEENV
jgi:tRNA(His) guanylyltransferase